MSWKEVSDPFEDCPDLLCLTEADLMAAWKLMDWIEDYKPLENPYVGWSEIDDYDKVEFIMNLEKIKSISIPDYVADFFLRNGLGLFKERFRELKIDELL